MAHDKAYFAAEEIIEKIRLSKAKELTLRVDLNASDEAKLTELPESIKKLTWLKKLDLSGNNLSILPDWIDAFSKLESLDVSRNKLTELPKWWERLIQLQELDLSDNQLTALPESL